MIFFFQCVDLRYFFRIRVQFYFFSRFFVLILRDKHDHILFMIPLKKGCFQGDFRKINHDLICGSPHGGSPLWFYCNYLPISSVFTDFLILLKNENCELSIFVFQNASKRHVLAFLSLFLYQNTIRLFIFLRLLTSLSYLNEPLMYARVLLLISPEIPSSRFC